MSIFKKVFVVVSAVAFTLGLSGLIRAATTVSLGTADNFAVLAGAGITNTGPTTITGDVGTHPTPTETGFASITLNGTNHADDTVTQGAKTDLTTAYLNAAGQGPTSPIVADLGGQTLSPGIYNSASSIGLTGTTTLDGGGDTDAVFIFQAGSTLTTASASVVALTNGTQACNVFWQVGSSATLGTNSIFKGNILALTSVTLTTGANVAGRVLARNGAVTLDTNTIAKATCAVAPTSTPTSTPASTPAASPSNNNYNTITVIKHVVNDNGGTAKYPSFPLFINGNPVDSGQSVSFDTGIYTVTETNLPNYKTTFSGDCDANGRINHGGIGTQNNICIVTNDDVGAPVTLPPVPPLIDVVKVPSPLALPAGPGSVTYTYTLRNVGTVPVTDITMVGDTCSPINLISGDTNADGKLGVKETWVYKCSATLTETHTNTVVAVGWANGISATDIANATVIVGVPIVPPLIHITKIPNPLTLLAAGGMVTYTKKVTNPGTVALSNVRVTDDKCSPTYISGDTNHDSKLDTTETWTYTCRTNLTKTTVNTAIATGEANGLTVRDLAIATVVVASPGLPEAGLAPGERNIMRVIVTLIGVFMLVSASLVVFLRKRAV